MEKLFAIQGVARFAEARGAMEGVGIPVLEFTVATSGDNAVEKVFADMGAEEDRWIEEANALLRKGQRHIAMRPLQPISKKEWRAQAVEVPGYNILIEKVGDGAQK